MKIEDAIRELKLLKITKCNCIVCRNTNDAIELAISGLEKQIPKKLKIYKNLNETTCPECGWVFGYAGEEYDGEKYTYCPNCGQALLWR